MTRFVSDEQLDNWFAHHPPTDPSIAEAHGRIRAEYGALAKNMNGLLPEGPDKTVALRAIRDAALQANTVIACTQTLHSD